MIPNLSKDMIDIMQQLRKRLRSEFNLELKLSQPDIVPQLLEHVKKSHDQRTQLLFADLEDMMGVQLMTPKSSTLAATSAQPTKRMYRGCPIADTPSMHVGQSSKRMYRGQVVT